MNESISPAAKELLRLLISIAPAESAAIADNEFQDPIDPENLTSLLGDPLEAWEQGISAFTPPSLIDVIASSNTGLEILLESDVALLKRVMTDRDDVERKGAFGLNNAAFPIEMSGRVVFCTWVRRYRTEPFSEEETKRLIEVTGLSWKDLEPHLDTTPILTRQQEESLLKQARNMRDVMAGALDEHLRAAELSRQMLQSEQTLAVGTLADSIAHRFNNLLSIILGYSSFVANRETISHEASDAMKKISEAAQKGRRLTEEILAFSGGDMEGETTCHVHSILTSILSLLQTQASSRVRVDLALAAETDAVTAPPSNIHQLVFNLLTNAIDGIPQGGDLSISSTNAIDTKDGTEVQYLHITIIDSGGILPAGYTDNENESESSASPELKFTLANGILNTLGGDVTVTTDPGQTTQVDVRIPTTEAPASETPVVTSGGHLGPAAIWVVDDDSIFRIMCQQVLGDEGHQMTTMETGHEMQQHWQEAEGNPDLMIIDFSMPEYNGLELCEWLQQQGSEVPVILVSGFSESQPDIRKALQIRKTYFLSKPFSYSELVDTVTIALGEGLIDD